MVTRSCSVPTRLRLGVAAGDSVVMGIAQGTVTPAGVVPRMRRFTVAGVFFWGCTRSTAASRSRTCRTRPSSGARRMPGTARARSYPVATHCELDAPPRTVHANLQTEIADTSRPSPLRASSSLRTAAGRRRSATPSAYQSKMCVSSSSAPILAAAGALAGLLARRASKGVPRRCSVSGAVDRRDHRALEPRGALHVAEVGPRLRRHGRRATGLPCFVITIGWPVREQYADEEDAEHFFSVPFFFFFFVVA